MGLEKKLGYKILTTATILGLGMAAVGIASASSPDHSNLDNSPKSGWDQPNESDQSIIPNNENYIPEIGISPVTKTPDIAPKTDANLPGFEIKFQDLPNVTGRFFQSEGLKGFAVLNTPRAPVLDEYLKAGGINKLGLPISSSTRGPLGEEVQQFQGGTLRITVDKTVDKNGEVKKTEIVKAVSETEMQALYKNWKEKVKPGISTSPTLSLFKERPNPADPQFLASASQGPDKENTIIPQTSKTPQNIEDIHKMEVAAATLVDMSNAFIPYMYPGEKWTYIQQTANGPATTTFSIKSPEMFCGSPVFPLHIEKSNDAAYWAPGTNRVLDFLVSRNFVNGNFIALGDRRYDPDGTLLRQTSYQTTDIMTLKPAYLLFPRTINLNETFANLQSYYSGCPGQGQPWYAQWNMFAERKNIVTPAYSGEVIAITYIEFYRDKVWAKERWSWVQNGKLIPPPRIEIYDETAPDNIVLTLDMTDYSIIIDGTLGGGVDTLGTKQNQVPVQKINSIDPFGKTPEPVNAGRYIYGDKDYKKVSSKDLVITEISKESAMAYKNYGFNESDKFAPYDRMAKIKEAKEKMLAQISSYSHKNT